MLGMSLDRITAEEADASQLTGSASYVNQALRTLRRLLGKAVEWNVISAAPRIKLLKEVGANRPLIPKPKQDCSQLRSSQ